MGFGYLLLGYLVTYVLKLLAGALQVGFLALFVGYGTMLLGLLRLRRYCRAFTAAAWSLAPLLLIAVYRMLESLSNAFLWQLSILGGAWPNLVGWAEFFFTMLFHAVLLSAVRELAMRVELKSVADAAVRNAIIVLLYGVIYVLYALQIPAFEGITDYVGLSMTLLNLAWIFCNLFLLLSCAKNICPAGEEDPAPRRYRWGFLNRIGDAFGNTFRSAADRSREDVENYLKKKQEKRDAEQSGSASEKPRHKHKKKK